MKSLKVVIIFLLFAALLTSCESLDSDEYRCDSTSPNRVGAICNDGTRSSSVGSGTCSSHGGVDYWLCRN